jgi:asparagine synthase (glutamine-hydrolysing)
MCGICGFQYQDTSRGVDKSLVAQMNSAMQHRGPDDSGYWSKGHIALAARRLSIRDVALGHQPMSNEDDTWAVAFNGEIYNAADLRSELEKSGYRFSTTCDTEVVLRAYEAWGESAVERFNGMFAIAAYDAREDCLLLARDRLGIKPMYYTTANGAFAFASELDALTRSTLISGKLNRYAIEAYFHYLYVPAPDSIFAGVHKLRPGEMLRYRKGEVSVSRYWTPQYDIDESWTLDSAAERFTELLEDSVRIRTVSDVPLGAFLSGGLDSSAIVGMLSRVSSDPVKTFSIGFNDRDANELEYARTVANHFQTDHTEAILHPDVTSLAGSFSRYFGEPFADSSAIPTWIVSKIARESVTVALSGDGGDELFAGYSWLHTNLQVARYRKVPAPIRSMIGAALSLGTQTPFMRKLSRFHKDAYRSPMDSFRRREQCFDQPFLDDLFLPHVVKGLDQEWTGRFLEHADASVSLSDPDRMLYQDTVMYLPDDILTKVDRMSMANSLEARVPLLDHRLVEFAATVPFHLKYAQGTSKRLVKHAMKGILPEETLQQRKRGFSIPIHRWFREDLNDYFQDIVLRHDSHCRDYLDMSEVKRLVDVHQSGTENYGHHLWVLLMFEHWLTYASKLPGMSISL